MPKANDLPARRAEPGAEFEYYVDDERRRLKAGDDGLVHPKTDADAAMLDRYELPLVRAEKKADAATKEG